MVNSPTFVCKLIGWIVSPYLSAYGVDARVDVWEGMPHGFLSGIGTLAASNQALDEIGRFLADRLNLLDLG